MKNSRYLRSFFSLSAKLLIIAVLFFAGTYVFEILNSMHIGSSNVAVNVDADGSVDVWWPTDGSHISDTQTFKAMVQDHNASDYDMYWSVDGGQQNQMYDSQTDYPHKEAVVDLSTWNWKGSGPYAVTFRAVDKSGNPLGQSTVNVYTLSAQQAPTTVVSGSVVAAMTGIQTASAQVVTQSTSAPQTQTSQPAVTNSSSSSSGSSQTNSAPVQSQPQSGSMSIWWPTDGTTVTGVQPFKSVINGMPLDAYSMYWQVDGGQLNSLSDNSDSGDHKEMSVDVSSWNWRGTGPYTVTFVAKNPGGNVIAEQNVTIYTGSHAETSPAQPVSVSQVQTTPVVAQSTPVTITSVQTPIVTNQNQSSSGNPFAGKMFYLDPTNAAKQYADSIRASDPTDAAQMDKIGNTPTAIWLGNWNSDVGSFVQQTLQAAQSQNTIPTFVIYNIPLRDCGQYSAGGANNPDGYKQWIQQIANATGNSTAAFILEPDATALTTCLSQSELQDRYDMLKSAVGMLKAQPNAHVYIDAGHPNWISADDMAQRLTQAGISQADGFALNTSNFYSTQDNITYGTALSNDLGGKHFVIDTGRNGLGPTSDQQWCNPPGRALGNKPTGNTGNPLVDAFLWLKGPGGSDGNCNGGPSAGVFWPSYALDMAQRSAY